MITEGWGVDAWHQGLGNTLQWDSFMRCALVLQIMSNACWVYYARKTVLYLPSL